VETITVLYRKDYKVGKKGEKVTVVL